MERFDLKKKFPGYFDITIFRFFLFMIFFLAFVDVALNDWQLQSLTLECPESAVQPCVNPVYVCGEGEYYDCQVEVPDWACPDDLCHQKLLDPGFKYGRDDPLAQFSIFIVLFLILMAFAVNHVKYVLMTGNWTYKRKNKLEVDKSDSWLKKL